MKRKSFKKLVALLTACLMLAVTSGCGNQVEPVEEHDVDVVTSTTEDVEEVVHESEDALSQNVVESVSDSEGVETANEEDSIYVSPEEVDEKLNLVEYEQSYEDRDYQPARMQKIWTSEFEQCYEEVTLVDSVFLYLDEDICIGYTKPNINVQIVKRQDDWCQLLDVSGKYALVKYSDIESARSDSGDSTVIAENSTPLEDGKDTVETPVEQDSTIENPVPEVPIEIPEVPVESDKYTPEEAIAVYRSILEGAGITWDPSIKEFASWGTGFLYLDKDYVEEAGKSSIEAMQRGDSVGNSWTLYYLEVTGSDDECVYITKWHSY